MAASEQALMVQPAQERPELDPAEVCFLVLHWLAAGPCRGAARALEAEALRHGLLPQGPNLPSMSSAGQHAAEAVAASSYAALRQQHPGLPSDALQQLLAQVLAAKHGSGVAGAEGLTTLLGSGPLAALPRLAATAPAIPAWLRRPHTTAGPLHSLLLRETGVCSRPAAPPALLAAHMQLLRTVRGHKLAIYCVAFDRTGRVLATGSDDHLVKIWCTTTATLLRTCRGHEAEVTDVRISADSALLASGASDTAVRIWSLDKPTLGWPVAVLTGHRGGNTYLDFSPVVPHVLATAGADGCCRLWDARAGGAPLAVLTTGADFQAGLKRSRTAAAAGASGSSALAGQPLQGRPNTRLRAGTAASDAVGDAAGLLGAQLAGPLAAAAQQQPAVQPAVAGGPYVSGSDELLAAGAEAEEAKVPALLCVRFSPCGTFLAAGSEDCTAYLWRWQLETPSNARPDGADGPGAQPTAAADQTFYTTRCAWHAAVPAAAAAATAGGHAYVIGDAAGGEPMCADEQGVQLWPAPHPLQHLPGHKNDITHLRFSRDGQGLVTSSIDGTMRIWRCAQHKLRTAAPAWEEAHVLVCAPVAEEAAAGAHRRRRARPMPAVNQAMWTADGARIVAGVSDGSVRVFDARTGAQLHLLLKHTMPVAVVDAHPTDGRLALSAADDGLLCLWDVEKGALLKSFCSKEGLPLPNCRWPDIIPRADCTWSPHGSSIAVGDVAGQISIVGCSGDATAMAAAPYDQFRASDYAPLLRDASGTVLDADTQTPPHLLEPSRQLLVDFLGHPYPEAAQDAYYSRRLAASGMVPPNDDLPQALKEEPPTVTAAAWLAIMQFDGRAVSSGVMQRAIAAAVAEAAERHNQLLDRLARGQAHTAAGTAAPDAVGAGDGDGDAGNDGRQGADRGGTGTGAALRGIQHDGGATAYADAVEGLLDDELLMEMEGSDWGRHDSASSADDSDFQFHDSDASGGRHSRWQRRQQRQQQQQQQQQQGTSRYGRPLRRVQQQEDTDDDHERRLRRSTRRSGGAAAGGAERAERPQRRMTRAAAASRRAHGHGSDGDEEDSSSGHKEGDDLDELLVGLSDEEEEEGTSADSMSSGEEGYAGSEDERPRKRRCLAGSQRDGRRQRTPATRRSSRLHGPEDEQQQHEEENGPALDAGHVRGSSRRQPQRRQECYAWLQASWRSPFAYVPQLGDDVVYLWQGHQQYLAETADKRAERPWEQLPLRPAEPCKVVNFSYGISVDGSHATLAQLTLQLSDPASPLLGQQMAVELPPLEGHREFVVLRAHYDAAVMRPWVAGNRAQGYFQHSTASADDNPRDTGAWSRCTVASDSRAGQAETEVLCDPYGCDGMWERYQVVWDEDAAAAAAAGGGAANAQEPAAVLHDPAAPSTSAAAGIAAAASAAPGSAALSTSTAHGSAPHALAHGTALGDAAADAVCPWELHPLGTTFDDVLGHEPGLAAEQVQQLLSILRQAAAAPRFSDFVRLPAPHERWRSGQGDVAYYNARVALPLALETMQCRLAQRYYRSVEALHHDLSTLAHNAATFHGPHHELVADAALLGRYVRALMAGEEPPDVAWGEDQGQQADEQQQRQRRQRGQQPQQQQQQDEQQRGDNPLSQAIEHVPRRHRSQAAARQRHVARQHSGIGSDADAGDDNTGGRSMQGPAASLPGIARQAQRRSGSAQPSTPSGAPSPAGRRRSSRLVQSGAPEPRRSQQQDGATVHGLRLRTRRHATQRLHEDEVSGGELSEGEQRGVAARAVRPRRNAARRMHEDEVSGGELSDGDADGSWQAAGGSWREAETAQADAGGMELQGAGAGRRSRRNRNMHQLHSQQPGAEPQGEPAEPAGTEPAGSTRTSQGAEQQARPAPTTERVPDSGPSRGQLGLRVRLPAAAAAAAAGPSTMHPAAQSRPAQGSVTEGSPAEQQQAQTQGLPWRIKVKLRRTNS